MPRRRRSLTLFLAFFAILALLFSGGNAVQRVDAVGKDAAYENLQTFTNILSIVQKNYVDEVDTEQLVEGAINGMLDLARSAQRLPDARPLQRAAGRHQGQLRRPRHRDHVRNGVLTVVSPIEDTPALPRRRQGRRPDHQDRRRVHQGHDAGRGRQEDARPEGQQGHAHAQARGRQRSSSTSSLTREVIKIQSVKSKMLEKGYGYIRVTQFQERTADDLERALEDLEQATAAACEGIVLDLRNDPGGLLTQAVKVSDLFLDAGLIVYTDGRLENQKQKYFAHKPGHATPTSRWSCW